MSWKCPKCGSQRLTVVVQTEVRLTQYADGEFETDSVGNEHEWNEGSLMRCLDCEHADAALSFETEA